MSISIQPEGMNIGVIKKISLIPLYYLSNIPSSATGQISYNGLTIASGGSFEEIYHTLESSSFEETSERTRAGILWTKKVNLSIPKIRSEIIAVLRKYHNIQTAAILTDVNETSFLVFPLRMLPKKQIPGSISSKNAILIELTGKSIEESPVITDLP